MAKRKKKSTPSGRMVYKWRHIVSLNRTGDLTIDGQLLSVFLTTHQAQHPGKDLTFIVGKEEWERFGASGVTSKEQALLRETYHEEEELDFSKKVNIELWIDRSDILDHLGGLVTR